MYVGVSFAPRQEKADGPPVLGRTRVYDGKVSRTPRLALRRKKTRDQLRRGFAGRDVSSQTRPGLKQQPGECRFGANTVKYERGAVMAESGCILQTVSHGAG